MASTKEQLVALGDQWLQIGYEAAMNAVLDALGDTSDFAAAPIAVAGVYAADGAHSCGLAREGVERD